MDSSKHHDPYRADSDLGDNQEAAEMARFRGERWERAGASPEEVAILSEEFDRLSDADAELEGRTIDALADGSLADVLAGRRQSDAGLVNGPVRQVLADVGEDPGKAALALAAEQARPNPRSSLIKGLEAVIEAAPPGAPADPSAPPAPGAATAAISGPPGAIIPATAPDASAGQPGPSAAPAG